MALLRSAWYEALLQRRSWEHDGVTPVDELDITMPPGTGGRFGRRRTPLMLAAMGGHAAAVTLLLQLGADATLRDGDGKTALEHAASEAVCVALAQAAPAAERLALNARLVHHVAGGSVVEAEAALARGAFTEAMHGASFPCGLFPLHHAARLGDPRMLRALLARGAHTEAPSLLQNGQTSLSFAVAYGHLEAVQLLLAAGARVHVHDLAAPRPESCTVATWQQLQAALRSQVRDLALTAPNVVDLTTDEEAEGAAGEGPADPAALLAAMAAQLAAMTQRALAAEARAAELESAERAAARSARDAARSMRSTEAHANAIIGVKREHLEVALTAAASAEATAARAERALEDRLTCILCCETPREVVVLPCLHLFACLSCFRGMKEKAEDDARSAQPVAASTRGQAAASVLPKLLCSICRGVVDVDRVMALHTSKEGKEVVVRFS